MPHVTLQFGPGGPILDAYIGVSQARRDALLLAGQPIPGLVMIRALVDTGASSTCVDQAVFAQLSLTPTGSISVHTPTTGDQAATRDQYDISVVIPGRPGTPPFIVNTMPVIGTELLASQGIAALIGRDILSECLFTFNGTVGLFVLAY